MITLVFISPTNAKLNRLARVAAEDPSIVDAVEVQRLLQRWKFLNYGRTALALLGSVIGLYVTLFCKL